MRKARCPMTFISVTRKNAWIGLGNRIMFSLIPSFYKFEHDIVYSLSVEEFDRIILSRVGSESN
jgi:hypothetical protein